VIFHSCVSFPEGTILSTEAHCDQVEMTEMSKGPNIKPLPQVHLSPDTAGQDGRPAPGSCRWLLLHNFKVSNLSGWWLTYPSEKWWSSSVGMMTFPIYGKTKNIPNHQSAIYRIYQLWGDCFDLCVFYWGVHLWQLGRYHPISWRTDWFPRSRWKHTQDHPRTKNACIHRIKPCMYVLYCIVLCCILLYCVILYWFVLYCIVLCCIVLYCIVLCCIVLCCIVLYCVVLYCVVFDCIVLYCIVLCCIVLYCVVLCCSVLCCVVLCCVVLYCIVLHCVVLYCIVLYCVVLCCIVLYCIVCMYVILCCVV